MTPIVDLKDGGSHSISIPLLKQLPHQENLNFTYQLKIFGKLAGDKLDSLFLELFKGKGPFESVQEMRDIFHGFANRFDEPLNLDR